MKRTFYDMLGVPHNAGQAELEAAFKLQTGKLNAANLRGRSEAVAALKLLREGYQILSDPEQRARYDAKLTAAKSGVDLVFIPDGSAVHRKGIREAVVLFVLVTVLGCVIYYQISRKMDQVRIEHAQAVIRQQEEKAKVITVDTMQSTPVTSAALDKKKSALAGKR